MEDFSESRALLDFSILDIGYLLGIISRHIRNRLKSWLR